MRRAHAMPAGESSTLAHMKDNLDEIMLRLAYFGSGGISALGSGYDPFVFRIGSCPFIVAMRTIKYQSKVEAPEDSLGFRDVPELSMVELVQDLQAALSLNKSQLARVLRVSRAALNDWLRGREPNAANAERAHILLRCLAQARVTAARPLNARFVRQPADVAGPALLDILGEEQIDEDRVVAAIQQARALGDAAARRRAAREERLRNLGFEDPGREQRTEQLARNMALRAWPNP